MIFGFFKKKETDAERSERERQELSIASLERGGLPVRAQERLKRFRDEGGKLFTSDLEAQEFLLVKEAGYEVVSQVMGSGFMNISLLGSWTVSRSTGELTDRTNALIQARYLAVSRLKQEIAGLGAHGAIGVKLEVKNYNWAARLIEVTAIGTAIRIPGRPQSENVFTCHLSGQEFWQLYEGGHMPISLVIGGSCYYVYTDQATQNRLTNFWGSNNKTNQEIQLYTQGFNDAYNRAVSRLTQQSNEVEAEGIVGVDLFHYIQDIEYESGYTHHDMLITVMAHGTAIAKDTHPRQVRQLQPLMIMDLKKGNRRSTSQLAAERLVPSLSADSNDDDDE